MFCLLVLVALLYSFSSFLVALFNWRPNNEGCNSLALPTTKFLTWTSIWFAQFAMGAHSWLKISLTLTIADGLCYPCGCLPTQSILWFYEYGKIPQSGQGRAGISISSTCTDDGPFPWTQQCQWSICTQNMAHVKGLFSSHLRIKNL